MFKANQYQNQNSWMKMIEEIAVRTQLCISPYVLFGVHVDFFRYEGRRGGDCCDNIFTPNIININII